MAALTLFAPFFLILFHLLLSECCPSGTPNGCSCNNRIFNCSGQSLTSIPTSLTSDYDVIDLSNNNLVSVPTGAFQNLAVQRIILMDNGITDILPGGFSDLDQLTSLNLQRNSLTSLDQTGFNRVANLNELLLDGNSFDCSADDITWLKAWYGSGDSATLTGTCSSGGTIVDALGSVAEPTSAVFSFEESEYRVSEAAGTVSLIITRSGVTSTRIDFDIALIDGTAVAGIDFVSLITARHTMLEGQTRMEVDVLLIDDPLIEDDESFIAMITIQSRGDANVGVIGAYGSTTVIILDNDSPLPPTTTPVPTTTTASTTTEFEISSQSGTDPMDVTTNAPGTTQALQPSNQSVNVAAIVVPIILIIVIIAVIIGFLWYRHTRAALKGTTAGVRYAAVQNRGKVYGDVTAKA